MSPRFLWRHRLRLVYAMSFEPCTTPSGGEYLEIPSTQGLFSALRYASCFSCVRIWGDTPQALSVMEKNGRDELTQCIVKKGASQMITYSVELTLRYRLTQDDVAHVATERVTIARTACPFGGRAPGSTARDARAGWRWLYLRWGYFACRHSQRVAYSSQSSDALERMWRTSNPRLRRAWMNIGNDPRA